MQYVHHIVVTLLAEKLRRYWIDTRGLFKVLETSTNCMRHPNPQRTSVYTELA